MTFAIRIFEPADTAAVIALWHAASLTRPWNDPARDIERKLTEQPELFFVAVDGSDVVGSVMVGWDGHRGWLSYLASAPERRGEGIGRALVGQAERALTAVGCPKLMLMVRSDNTEALAFYDALGYGADDVVVRGKRLIADE